MLHLELMGWTWRLRSSSQNSIDGHAPIKSDTAEMMRKTIEISRNDAEVMFCNCHKSVDR
jgi:hypothetical protein